jgi:hypothetical protein
VPVRASPLAQITRQAGNHGHRPKKLRYSGAYLPFER